MLTLFLHGGFCDHLVLFGSLKKKKTHWLHRFGNQAPTSSSCSGFGHFYVIKLLSLSQMRATSKVYAFLLMNGFGSMHGIHKVSYFMGH